jgi:hypothetical protein
MHVVRIVSLTYRCSLRSRKLAWFRVVFERFPATRLRSPRFRPLWSFPKTYLLSSEQLWSQTTSYYHARSLGTKRDREGRGDFELFLLCMLRGSFDKRAFFNVLRRLRKLE